MKINLFLECAMYSISTGCRGGNLESVLDLEVLHNIALSFVDTYGSSLPIRKDGK